MRDNDPYSYNNYDHYIYSISNIEYDIDLVYLLEEEKTELLLKESDLSEANKVIEKIKSNIVALRK